MSHIIEAYPLCWPPSKKRYQYHRQDSRFKTSFSSSCKEVLKQIELLGGWGWRTTKTIISTNMPLRKDGLPYANTRVLDDPGVAVYFIYKGKQMCFACDKWRKIEDNMQAIAKTIEALRGISRWGSDDMMEAAFTGFASLPPPSPQSKGWQEILEVPADATYKEVEQSYKKLRSQHHPDKGGSANWFIHIEQAWKKANEYFETK